MNFLTASNFVVSFYTLGLGMVVLRTSPNASKNKHFFVLGCSVFLWLFPYGLMYHSQRLESAVIFGKIGHLGAIILTPVIYSLFCSILGPYTKSFDTKLFWLSIAAAGTAAICLFTSSFYFQTAAKHPWGYYPLGGPLMTLYAFWTFFVAVRCIYNLVSASSRAKRDFKLNEYNRFKFYAISLSIFMLASLDYLPKFGADIHVYPFGQIMVGIFCSLITYAVLRHKLFDVDFFIRRGFVYSLLALSITFAYLAIILISEHYFRARFGYKSIFIALTTSFFIAIIFNPLRERIQKIIDRYFYKIEPEKLAEENKLLKANLYDHQRMKTVTTLAAGMAHEIKNPLTAIKTFTEFLPHKTQDPEFLKQFHKIVTAEVGKIDSIVRQLLEFSKPAPLKLESMDLIQALENNLLLLEAQCVKNNIQIVRNFPGQPVLINGDKKQLQQAFLNLFLNSIQAMPQGGFLEVSLKINPNNAPEIQIRDTGCGIPKENLPHIFDPFFTTKQDGTGLGLAITHGILKEHGFDLLIQSAKIKGTLVILLFNKYDDQL